MSQSYLNLLTNRIAWSPPDSVRDRPIMGAVMGQHSTLIVETGASPAHANQFRAALTELHPAMPRFAMLTHWHWDHVFGTSTMKLPTIAHVETRRHVQEMARLDWRDNALNTRLAAGHELAFIIDHMRVEMTNIERAALVISVPELAFTEQVEVDLGDLTAQIIHVGGDHARDSSIVFIPEERVAFLGDCYYSGFIGIDRFYTMARLLPLLDQLEALPVDYYLLSHNPDPMPRAEFLHEAGRLRRIGAAVEQTGGDRTAAQAALTNASAEPFDEYAYEDLEAFLRGLQPDIGLAY